MYLRPHSHFFIFNPTAPTYIYTLSLHDALPILLSGGIPQIFRNTPISGQNNGNPSNSNSSSSNIAYTNSANIPSRSEEHTSELQSRRDLVCRLLLEKKKQR